MDSMGLWMGVSPAGGCYVRGGINVGGDLRSLLENTVSLFIANRPIIDLCMVVERRIGSRKDKWWWKKDGLDLEGMRKAAWKAERMAGGEGVFMKHYFRARSNINMHKI